MYMDLALNDGCASPRYSSRRAASAARRAMQRLRARVGIRERIPRPETADGAPIVAAFEERLKSIEKEIDRLTCLASEEQDIAGQEEYLALARDLQRDAREIRNQIRLHQG